MKLGEKDFAEACLPFEKPIAELEKTINDLKTHSKEGIDLSEEIKSTEKKLERAIKDIFSNLTPWQRVQVARHPLRPYTLDYLSVIAEDFVEFHGDRYFGDDKAIIGGLARIGGRRVCVIGQQKGRDTKENLKRCFGSANPEGYRKAMRLMKLAEKSNLPVISFIDTPGAYPGIGAEERGQAEAIALNLHEMAILSVPIVAIVIGEGGSGGALGIGIGDKVLILENAYYSVISPEGCAAILWKDNTQAPLAAEALKLTSYDLLEMGVVDEIVKEPLGGAHRNFEETAENVKEAILRHLRELSLLSKKELLQTRYEKYRTLGVFEEKKPE
ncbi:MAG: acetyl-CoA carboxylase carboxyltransferase subunit alpha [Candidatus Omnitrophica bacterium]|nr:acetyl-CoA carboxylase carboxyltransferase subunit alpha [Candidatus Omnitrophota bacterium]